MTNESYKDYPVAQVKKQPFISLIWLIPIVALIAGAWLMTKVYLEKGPTVVIDFESAQGIKVNSTQIRYKDVDIGKVKYIELKPRITTTESGEEVKQVRALVTAELDSFMEDYLGSDTVFWVVKPRISVGQVSGLSTLFSGFYIEMDPGKQADGEQDIYEGLENPPKVASYARGKVITLNAKNLGSLNEGSPVYYHQLKVGEVIDSQLNIDTESVDISIYIQDKYKDKIRANTRFWNVSGVDVEVTPSGGVSAKMESLAALVIGGIAFDTPKGVGHDTVLSGDTVFHLYDSHKQSLEDTSGENKLYYAMYFSDTLFGLIEGSTVEYQGVQVGKVEKILLKKDSKKGEVKTVVKVSLFVDKLSDHNDRTEAEEILTKLVDKGLHGQLQTSSLLTGSQYVALVFSKENKHNKLAKLETSQGSELSVFPTTAAANSLLNFDASELTTELTKTIREVRKVVASNDIKKIVSETGKLAKNINDLTRDLNKKGISGELVKTLKKTQEAIVTIQQTAKASQGAIKAIQQTAKTTQNTINQSLGEDSALQYKLQVMLDDLSETANSFSVLADTLQRKPNAVILGK